MQKVVIRSPPSTVFHNTVNPLTGVVMVIEIGTATAVFFWQNWAQPKPRF